MKKSDLAQALGISASMVSRLSKRGMPVDCVERAKRWRKRHIEPGRIKDTRYDPSAHAKQQEQVHEAIAQAVQEAVEQSGPPLRDAIGLLDEAINDTLKKLGGASTEMAATLQGIRRQMFYLVVLRCGGLEGVGLYWWQWLDLVPPALANNEAMAEFLDKFCPEPLTLAAFHALVVEYFQGVAPGATPIPLGLLKAEFIRLGA